MRIDYNIKDKFDFGLFLPALALFGFGLLAIYSSTINNTFAQENFQRQIVWGVFAFIIFFITYSLPTNVFKTLAIPGYIVSLLLLVAVLGIGRQISGSKSWLVIGAVGFQPSELAKIATIIAIAAYLSRNSSNIDSFKDILFTLIIGFTPVMLILLEPDMGTSIVFMGVILMMFFWKGISSFSLFVVLSPAFVAIASIFGTVYFIIAMLLVIALLITFKRNLFFSASIFAIGLASGFFADYVYHALSPHQQRRIQSFLDPNADPLGSGYNTIQAKVAIGSGGLLGKGFLSGNQTQLQFIPEQWTDFAFCVIGEEFGFIGSIIVISIFLILFLRILKLTFNTKDEFLSLVSIGILTVYLIHFIINLGMVVGILPVIGIPLPFISYGGSSLLVNLFMLGILANLYRTRKNYT
ncbi:MAG: rod shape-determining protein RodA [Ignavibacteriales bacterium]|nr:MAG: rod shape-determining protein RodA [Chlorobiota bacterium]MBE7477668.1 rod shape-determining protein RodA [Ignavibacteriales bacterium]